MKLNAIIFDFDGTLAELTIDFELMKHKLAAIYEAYTEERPDIPQKPILEWIQDLADDIAEYEGQDMGMEFHTRARLTIQATELDAAKKATLFPFTRDLLARLRRRGVKTGIITRNSTPAVKTVFPDIESCCDVFIPREDAPQVKPHPAHIQAALERMETPAQNALMVGDHVLDVQTGQGAGVPTAGVASGNLDETALAKNGADRTAANADQLIDELVRQGII